MAAALASLAMSAAAGVVKGIADQIAGSASPKDDPRAKAQKTAQDFETMFLEQMLERMTTGLGEDGPLGENGTGGPVFRSMLMKEYAAGIVKSGGIGLSGQIMGEMLKMQEGPGRAAS